MDNGFDIGWRAEKAEINRRKHGVRFEEARQFEFDTAMIEIDDAIAYGEERLVATGFIGRQVHVLVYVERGGKVWVISLRRAGKREVRRYARYCEG